MTSYKTIPFKRFTNQNIEIKRNNRMFAKQKIHQHINGTANKVGNRTSMLRSSGPNDLGNDTK